MSLHPILSALRRHKTGTILIALQIALTLAIVCNALFIIRARFEHMARVTGIDEHDLFQVESTHTGIDSDTDAGKATLNASIKADLAALRQLPDVVDVYETNSLPLTNNLWSDGFSFTPGVPPDVPTGFYNAD